MFVDQSNEIMKNKGQVNLEALHSDFEKVIKVLNSSTIQQHVTASDRMLELLVKKWDSMVEKSQGSVNIMSILLSMLPIYKTNRELVSKRLTIIQ
jgi:nucleosome binding factor SPN SPT16 subunit